MRVLLKRGLKSSLPTADLVENEPVIATDDDSFWVKRGENIQKITDVVFVDSYNTLEQKDKKEGKLYIVKSNEEMGNNPSLYFKDNASANSIKEIVSTANITNNKIRSYMKV